MDGQAIVPSGISSSGAQLSSAFHAKQQQRSVTLPYGHPLKRLATSAVIQAFPAQPDFDAGSCRRRVRLSGRRSEGRRALPARGMSPTWPDQRLLRSRSVSTEAGSARPPQSLGRGQPLPVSRPVARERKGRVEQRVRRPGSRHVETPVDRLAVWAVDWVRRDQRDRDAIVDLLVSVSHPAVNPMAEPDPPIVPVTKVAGPSACGPPNEDQRIPV